MLKKRVLEVIDDDEDTNRRSSNDVGASVNDEVYNFLRSNELEFLAEYFTGQFSKTTLSDLREMSEEDLIELFGGPLYVSRI